VDIEREGRIIEQHFNNLIIFNIYFPNGKLNQERLEYKLKFYENFLNYCLELREKGNSLIICGDFNTAYQNIDLKKGRIHNNSGFVNSNLSIFIIVTWIKFY
jgi:exodeoxyribonuclease III